MNDLVIKQAPKRVQFSIPLKLGGKEGDIEIGVSGWVSLRVACSLNWTRDRWLTLKLFTHLGTRQGTAKVRADARSDGGGSRHAIRIHLGCRSEPPRNVIQL
jgi:hypothetical protein